MVTGSLIALFYALIAMIGAISGLVFVLGIGKVLP